MSQLPIDFAKKRVESAFAGAGFMGALIEVRDYPDETIFVVRVRSDEVERATTLGNSLDTDLQAAGISGFVVIRAKDPSDSSKSPDLVVVRGVSDARVVALANLMRQRARTTEVQPSLSYIRDSADTLSTVLTRRHHLIFGRRGAGKTALMVEAKRQLDERGVSTVWINVQTVRREPVARAFCWVVKHVVESMLKEQRFVSPRLSGEISELYDAVQDLLGQESNPALAAASRLAPRLQHCVRRFIEHSERSLYLFVDDLHYLRREDQPVVLDLVHGAFRDNDAWIKVASIRHLSRWFQPSPPTGLQTGHDADHIDLDLSLEAPSDAKVFLEEILQTYARSAGVSNANNVYSRDARDRLVLASGAVPRDYLVLAAGAINEARKRAKARTVGVEDVNRAAGDAAQVKISEIEDDAAASQSRTRQIVAALQSVRQFCLEEKKCTFFRVDFEDKEQNVEAYGLLQSLLDLRLLHLVNSSLSDKHEAGRRAEVYMLDLSQFSGQRLKKHLRVLDFARGDIVLKVTGSAGDNTKIGDTSRKLLQILRTGQAFPLGRLSSAD